MIKRATIEDIDLIFPLCDKFAESSKFVEYDRKIFKSNWIHLIQVDIGVIFAYTENDRVVGMIGGMYYPSILTGEKIATELFWFVDPDCRGGVGKKLLNAFEDWAKDKGCTKVIMVSLADLMPETVGGIYKNRGYEKMETHYIREV